MLCSCVRVYLRGLCEIYCVMLYGVSCVVVCVAFWCVCFALIMLTMCLMFLGFIV